MEVLNINGIEKQFPDGIPKTLIELLKQLDIHQATVVAEINGKIIDRQNFSQTRVSPGQKIELVRCVGGG
ncbi:MAG: sulfur carrier protein ThiS [Planctomycetes bacterium]|nr:sulfur carrier protein ThiS [Planctomycetota bacterium]